jgi:peptidoglycan/LPS O-acetylase OafA/YrhL
VAGVVEWEVLFRHAGRTWLGSFPTVTDGLFGATLVLIALFVRGFHVPFGGLWELLGRRSYGIYLAHPVLLTAAGTGMYHLLPRVLGQQIVLQAVLITVGAGGPLVLMALLKRWGSPRAYWFVFGR